MNRNFMQLLRVRWAEGKFVCVGLDTEHSKLPQCVIKGSGHINDTCENILRFNKRIIDATKDIVSAYKPNSAFYEQYGAGGIDALRRTIEYANKMAPDVPMILDAKRADIGNTNEAYVRFAFDYLKADAITVHPYLGSEAMKPFLDCKDKGIIVLCRTSNKGAGEFQDWGNYVSVGEPLYERIAEVVAKVWNSNDNCLLVVGATYPNELKEIRKIVGDMPLLIPGIGAQGGDLEETLEAGLDSRGDGVIINSSRGIIYASSGENFAEAARRETLKLHEAIGNFRKTKMQCERA